MDELTTRYKELDLFKTVNILTRNQGIEINFIVGNDEEMTDYGYTQCSPANRKIDIVIKKEAVDKEEVFVHELLHAKLFLEGYPYIQVYQLTGINPFINKALESLSNSVQHTYVFANMKKMGCNQDSINKEFFEYVKEASLVKSEGAAKIGHIANFLELHLRSPLLLEEIKEDLYQRQPEAFSVFLKLKKLVKGINSPLTMRAAYSKIYQLVNQFILEQTGEDMHLNKIVLVSPVFVESLLVRRASDILYTFKHPGYPTVFVLDKINNQCCYFLSRHGANLEKEYVDMLLNRTTLKEAMEMLA